jgi:hypothetical protein
MSTRTALFQDCAEVAAVLKKIAAIAETLVLLAGDSVIPATSETLPTKADPGLPLPALWPKEDFP